MNNSKCFENNKTELISPIRIIGEEKVSFSEDLVNDCKYQVALRIKPRCVLKSGGYIILDYGKELHGGIRPVCGEITDENRNFTLANLHIRFGESLTESCSILGQKNSGNYHSMRDFKVSMTTNSSELFGSTGFRFVRIDNIGDSDVPIRSIPALSITFGGQKIGEFECDDSRINDIFNTAVHTLELCIYNGYIVDGIKRDRCVWIGDMHPEVLASFMLYGRIDEIKNSLEFAINNTPEGEWINMIPSYSLWYIMLVYEYCKYSGDRDYGKSVKEYVKVILQRFNSSLAEDGTYNPAYEKNIKLYSKNENFFDWPTNLTVDSEYGVRALMIIAFNRASSLYCDDTEIELMCKSLISRVIKKNNYESIYKQVVAMRVLAGVEEKKYATDFLIKGGASGLCCFMSYYILKAIAELGMPDKALEMLKEYYGGMLNMGATTFWEDFDTEWVDGSAKIDEFPKEGQKDIHGDFGRYCYTQFRHSLCHGWSVGVIPYLFEYVLGVKPSEDGFKEVLIEPHLGTLKHVKGKIPTPYGVISVEHEKTLDGNIKTNYTAPSEVTIKINAGENNDEKNGKENRFSKY